MSNEYLSEEEAMEHLNELMEGGPPNGDGANYEYSMEIMMAFMVGRAFQEGIENKTRGE